MRRLLRDAPFIMDHLIIQLSFIRQYIDTNLRRCVSLLIYTFFTRLFTNPNVLIPIKMLCIH